MYLINGLFGKKEDFILNEEEKKILFTAEKSPTMLIFEKCKMTDSLVTAITKKKNLQVVSLTDCSGISEQHIQEIAKVHQVSLQVFIVKESSNLRDILSDSVYQKISMMPKNPWSLQTLQINAPSVDSNGNAYFINSWQGKPALIKMNISNSGTPSVVNSSVANLTDAYGVMFSACGNNAIVVTAQQNEKNTGDTQIRIIDWVDNKNLSLPIQISKESTIYDAEIGSFPFKKGSSVWGYAIEVNSNNSQYLVNKTTVHAFSQDKDFESVSIPLEGFAPVEFMGCASSTFFSENELALIAYGSNMESCVFLIDLVAGKISQKYIVPVDLNKVDGGFTAITRVYDRKYGLAVMDARGDIYIGPAENSDQFVLEASMDQAFDHATFYTDFLYVGNGIFAFYSETKHPYLETKREIGFYDIDQKKHLSKHLIPVGGHSDFYMKRLTKLEDGKVGVTLVSRYLKNTTEPSWFYSEEFDIPSKENK